MASSNMDLSINNKPIAADNVLHLLPCKIDYVGPAPVAQYFDTSRVSIDETERTEMACFRGRPLNGAEIPLKEHGYRLFKATTAIDDGEQCPPNGFHATSEFDRFMYWNLDKPTSHQDQIRKVVSYLAAAEAFAEKDEETVDQ